MSSFILQRTMKVIELQKSLHSELVTNNSFVLLKKKLGEFHRPVEEKKSANC